MEHATRMHEEQSFDMNSIEEAFENFNQASEHLTEFYRGLEEQVTLLNEQLASAQEDRMREFQEKERLADRLANLLRVLPGGIVVLDGEGHVNECNPAAVSLLGEPLVGEAWRDVVARCFTPRWDDGHDITLRDGRYVNISTQSLQSEPGQILLIKDVTETRQLQEQFSHLKRLSAMGEMAASLAHQIRTPLSSAMLYASNLGRSVLDENVRKRFTEKIISRLKNLECLVEDMLLFSRGGRLESRIVPAASLLESVRQSLTSNTALDAPRISFHGDVIDGKLDINITAMCSAVQNLVNNSLESGPDINVSINFRSVNGETIAIEVSDDGPGIPGDIRHKLTEPFFTTRTHGTGLGLAVVDSVVRAHSGKLLLESSDDSGTCFSIQLPLINENRHRDDRRDS
ncbi:MAG: ATP-binding protein [Gammaproteobacteria bacterium]|nr:ATP-binding protein [Gammaproteobacteria bacterium]